MTSPSVGHVPLGTRPPCVLVLLGFAAHSRTNLRTEPLADTALADAIRDAALLEGDFVLRSGRRSSYYLDKYRFGTRPDLLRPLGAAIAEQVREHEPEAVRLAAPELGAVPLAAAASLESGLPFVIVRGERKEYGTGNRIEGPWEPGELVCLVEDVVTAGGAALEAVEALREVGLV